MRKIYITGCAKSGTTMVLGLFHAFQYPCIPIESGLAHFRTWWQHAVKHHDGIVGKRDNQAILCNIIPYMEQLRQLNHIKKYDIEVIHVVRNKEDVLKSDDGYVSEERYDEVARQAMVYQDIITTTINYEDILDDPMGMQYTVAMNLKLDMLRRWDDYPDYVPLMVGSSANWPTRRLGAPKDE